MKVILLKDVKNLGKQYDLKDVPSGYARNYLIPRGLAVGATNKALKWLEIQKDILNKKSEQELTRIGELAKRLDGLEISIPVKIGKKGQLFEKVTSQKIASKLKEKGFDVKKSQLELAQEIKELGEFPVKVKFEHGLEATIKTIVVEEKK
ncbi:50S ribosomal protein L9 [bacterium]|nr:50S ribosomal protein L9 [bacterium]